MDPIYWAILLLSVSLVLIVLELFIPSGGVIGATAGVCLLAAIVMAFRVSMFAGFTMVLAVLVATPATIVLGFKVWPHTPMGRAMLNLYAQEHAMAPEDPRKSLLGRVGTTKTKMLPSGAVTIDGKTYNAVTNGTPLEAGELVRVVKVEGNSMTVRPHKGPLHPEEAGEEATLDQSLESLGLDPFDDPLA